MTKYVLRSRDLPWYMPVSCDFKPEVEPKDAFKRACEVHEINPATATFFKVGELRSRSAGSFTEFYRQPGQWIVGPTPSHASDASTVCTKDIAT